MISHAAIVDLISRISDAYGQFEDRVEALAEKVALLDSEALSQLLLESGIIPERYAHDSSEEKLYAKYCDLLIDRFFSVLGMDSIVSKERADFADVLAEVRGEYLIVADAKAFRLSRTALNPKDFKIEALDGWRRKAEADYALLVGSLFLKRSRVYEEAIRYNVTMLTYPHLAYLLRHLDELDLERLADLWTVGKRMEETDHASEYWDNIRDTMFEVADSGPEWTELKHIYRENLLKQADEQRAFWKQEIERIGRMSHDNLVEEVIRAKKLQGKIAQIQKRAEELAETYL